MCNALYMKEVRTGCVEASRVVHSGNVILD